MKILAADDDPVFLELLVAVLGQAGYDDVTTALNAIDALREAQNAQTPFECFLLDINMPDWDGVELCAAIRALRQYSHTPILMVTALSSKFNIDRAFAAGATDYVTKPLDGLELGSRIRVAATLNAANKRELDAVSVMLLSEREAEPPQLDLTQRLELSGAENAIEFAALVTYLDRIRPGFYNMWLSDYRIAGVEDIHASVSFAEFRRMINEVGRSISLALDGTRFFLAYAGGGTFVTLCEGRRCKDELLIQLAIDARIAGLALVNRDRRPVTVVVSARRLSRRTTSTPASLIEDLTNLSWNAQETAQEILEQPL